MRRIKACFFFPSLGQICKGEGLSLSNDVMRPGWRVGRVVEFSEEGGNLSKASFYFRFYVLEVESAPLSIFHGISIRWII